MRSAFGTCGYMETELAKSILFWFRRDIVPLLVAGPEMPLSMKSSFGFKGNNGLDTALPTPRGFLSGIGSLEVDRIGRILLFLSIFWFFWISVSPFLSEPSISLEFQFKTSNRINQVVVIGLSLFSFVLLLTRDLRILKALMSPALIAMLGWLAFTVATSSHPDASLKHFVLTVFILVMSAAFLAVPESERQFAQLLAVGTIATLLLAYGGLVLVPSRAIHQGWDMVEPDLAGCWRGHFAQKNAAGSAMVMCVFIGVFIARKGWRLIGAGIGVAAIVFLFGTQSKTSIGLLAVALLLAGVALSVHRTVPRVAIVAIPLLLLVLFTVGSVIFPAISTILEQTGIDITFTNRTTIWRFAVAHLSEHPFTGQGLASFWGTFEILHSNLAMQTWASRATDAHNAYLDVALAAGLPGLVLALIWFVIIPLRELKPVETYSDPDLTRLFVRCWLFFLLSSSLESNFFAGGGVAWFMAVVSIFGLRLQSETSLRARKTVEAQ